ncbi:MAG: glycoside hydrolase family 3 protein [Pirellulales bacterium]
MKSLSHPRLLPANLSLRDKIAQLVMVRIGSHMAPVRSVEDDEQRIARLIDECPVGGLVLFNGGPQTKASLARLQAASPIPLLVASDIERGVGQQVAGHTLVPHAMAFEKLGPEATEVVAEFARSVAHEAREVGINVTFFPVADVNTNPRNPIIATRAFSENVERVVELTRAYVSASEAAGLPTTAKHFPGHGHTHKDSHDSLPIVDRSLRDLETCELPPFQAAIEAGCSLVMTAHVAYPAVDPSGVPATLSPLFLQKMLRDEMGFRGVVVSDSLLMAGLRDCFATEEEAALACLEAGVDLLLDPQEPVKVLDYLCAAVEKQELDANRIDEAFGRIWELKQRISSNVATSAPGENSKSDRLINVLAERVARGAIELIGTSRALPLNRNEPLGVILLKPFDRPSDPPEQPLAAALRERFRDVRYVQLGPQADQAAYDSARHLAASARQLLIAVIVRPAAWHAFGLRPQQSELVRQLTSGRTAVLASLGVPYVLSDYPEAAVRICTYSDVPASQQALAEYLVEARV